MFLIVDYRNFVFYFTRSRQLPVMATVLSRYNAPISVKFTKTIRLRAQAVNHLSILTNMTNITIDRSYSKKQAKNMLGLSLLTNLQSLNFESTNIKAGNPKLYKHLNKLTKLDVWAYPTIDTKTNLVDLAVSQELINHFSKPPNMSRLNILTFETLYGRFDKQTAAMLEPAYNLKKLDVGLAEPDGAFWMAQTMPLILRTLTALECLKTSYYLHVDNEICQLTRLTKLDVTKGNLSTEVTSKWTSLTNIKILSLSNIRHANSQDDYNFLTALTNLVDLTISDECMAPNNCLQLVPSTVTSLTANLAQNFSLDGLSRLVNLEWLTLSSCHGAPQIIDYSFLKFLKKLTRLDVSNEVPLSDSFRAALRLTKLQVLNLGHQSLEKFNVSKLPNLESLCMGAIPNKDFSILAGLTKLTQLELSGKVDMSHLEKLPLKILSTKRFLQNKEFWQRLPRLTSLESLEVALEQVDIKPSVELQESGIMSLTALPNLTELKVSRCAVRINFKCISLLTNLQKLMIPMCLDYDYCFKARKKMKYLYSIKIYQ
jgi:hypothetical protein